MFPTILLVAGLASGQAPVGGSPPAPLPIPSVTAPVAPVVPVPLPKATDTPGNARILVKQATQPPAAEPEVPNVTVQVPEEIKTDKEEPESESPPSRWAFMKAVQGTWLGVLLDDHKFNVYGWTQMSYNGSTDRNTNLPNAMADRPNEFLLNQNYLHFERTIDTSKREHQFGFVTETLIGSDYRFTLPRGLWNSQLSSNNGLPELYGIDVFQMYLQAFLPNIGPRGTKVIGGRFATHVGYELVQAVDTPFVTRSYMFEYDPFTHTGVWATTQLNDTWSVGNGLATGSDNFFDAPTSRANYLGQLKWAPPNGRSSAILNVVITNPKFIASENFAQYNFYNLLYTYKVNEKTNFIMDAGYAHMKDVPNIGATDWYGVANYVTYAFNDKVSGTVRAEVFEDTDGVRTGFRGLYTEVTGGVSWKPLPALILRPSVRWDYNANSVAFDGNRALLTGVMEAIIRW